MAKAFAYLVVGLRFPLILGWVELFTVLAIALIVGVRFRSVLAPVAALACAGAAYVLATRIVAWGAQRTGITVPQDADPVLIVLLLGVTTDYCVFFLAGMRSRLAEGAGRLQAVRDSTARSAPIVLAAGLIVAAGTGALVVARGGLLRAFGPGLAATVLVSMVVSLTLMPALLGVFGGLMFRGTPADDRPTAAGFRLARLAASKPVALLVAAGCVAGLVLAASGARGLGLGSPLIDEMPASSDVVRAGAAAAAGFAPGILAPAEVLVIGPGAGSQTAAANRLEAALRRQPGVASVVGPSALAASAPSANPMVARDGRAIRFARVRHRSAERHGDRAGAGPDGAAAGAGQRGWPARRPVRGRRTDRADQRRHHLDGVRTYGASFRSRPGCCWSRSDRITTCSWPAGSGRKHGHCRRGTRWP